MNDKQKELGGWVSVFAASTDYEADIVRDRLDSAGIVAAVFTQRDHAFNLTVGDLAKAYVMVPAESVEEARAVLAEHFSEAELDEASEGSVEDTGSKPGEEELLDSGIEKLHFDAPEDAPEDENLA